ncbi:hypothetical protein B0H14DRAFT_2843257 [Mycena olivaceomarginata]|nr:hypothetical protein B0H14DRAFT_2843257 [Mycena olivaceomarginata]
MSISLDGRSSTANIANKILVSNLPPHVTNAQIAALFQAGLHRDVTVTRSCFFPDRSARDRAFCQFNNHFIDGRPLKMEFIMTETAAADNRSTAPITRSRRGNGRSRSSKDEERTRLRRGPRSPSALPAADNGNTPPITRSKNGVTPRQRRGKGGESKGSEDEERARLDRELEEYMAEGLRSPSALPAADKGKIAPITCSKNGVTRGQWRGKAGSRSSEDEERARLDRELEEYMADGLRSPSALLSADKGNIGPITRSKTRGQRRGKAGSRSSEDEERARLDRELEEYMAERPTYLSIPLAG